MLDPPIDRGHRVPCGFHVGRIEEGASSFPRPFGPHHGKNTSSGVRPLACPDLLRTAIGAASDNPPRVDSGDVQAWLSRGDGRQTMRMQGSSARSHRPRTRGPFLPLVALLRALLGVPVVVGPRTRWVHLADPGRSHAGVARPPAQASSPPAASRSLLRSSCGSSVTATKLDSPDRYIVFIYRTPALRLGRDHAPLRVQPVEGGAVDPTR